MCDKKRILTRLNEQVLRTNINEEVRVDTKMESLGVFIGQIGQHEVEISLRCAFYIPSNSDSSDACWRNWITSQQNPSSSY